MTYNSIPSGTIELGGEWKIHSRDGRYKTHVQVPGTVFQALENDGVFGPKGLNYREENRVAMDVARRVFVFTREIAVSAGFIKKQGRRVFLECDGLDTLATVRLNDAVIGKADNMHRRWRFEVTGLIKAGRNTLVIEFADAVAFVEAAQKKRELWAVGGPSYKINALGFSQIRKSHCSYGWDWGAQVPDIGIWRSIRFAAYDGARLADVLIRQIHEGKKVCLTVLPEREVWDQGKYVVEVVLSDPEGREVARSRRTAGGLITLSVPSPRLWWPNGLGEQPLYTLQIHLIEIQKTKTFESGASAESIRASLSRRIGLRTITVDRSKLKIGGERFALKVNGLCVFAMGADWIPEDAILTRPVPGRTGRLIADAKAANFNCLRVWGGGVWPGEEFFDLCDEAGLLVWQDCMFACATYDVRNPAFRASIRAEIEDNVRRIRHHASLALVCGNNEMEWAFVDWKIPQSAATRREYLQQYEKLIPALLKKVAPDVYYWPASPSSGGGFDKPNDFDRGDQHDWSIWHGNKPYTTYRDNLHRFASEFGFESFPLAKSVRQFTVKSDRNIFSPVMEDHQRCVGGNGKILSYVAQYFRYPESFESLLYVSQCSQAEAIRYATEHWRRNRGVCMGAIYWQFNDNWPVASWASVDWYGRWKVLHYAARRFFSPVLLSCEENTTALTASIHLANERREGIAGMVTWSLQSLGGSVVRHGSVDVRLGPMSSKKLVSLNFSRELAGNRVREHVLVYRFQTPTSGFSQSQATVFAPFKSLSLGDPHLACAVGHEGDRVFVDVSASSFAKFVWLELSKADAIFNDNGFDLAAGETRRIWVERGADEATVRTELGAFSLRNTYAPTMVAKIKNSNRGRG